jgi:hypothetical protein
MWTTSVKEKAIAFSTDERLYHKMRSTRVRVAKEIGIELRQSYERLSKRDCDAYPPLSMSGSSMQASLQHERKFGVHY